VTVDDVHAAAARLRGIANQTPVMTSRTLDGRVGGQVFCKCESFQRVGAFKFRGAYNALALLREREPHAAERGVLTYSSGNHAQAIALASSLLGIRATIVMPDDAPRTKIAATRGYLGKGGEVVLYNRAEITREELGARLAQERGMTIVPPYDHPDVIAGQGTVALELFEVAGQLDWLFVCCGGGGLLSGCSIVARALGESRVVGVEPEAGDDACRSFETRELQSVRDPQTVADGARTPSLGRWTFPLVLANVDEMMSVSDGELCSAMHFAYERMKLVIEPTGALALAGLLRVARERGVAVHAQRIGVIVSGGNVDLDRLADFWALGREWEASA
jgi:threonine dehydratase